MALRSQRVLKTFLAGGDARRPAQALRETITITLPPEPGVSPSNKPAVRIYVGTESAQFRAERVFVWSIKRVRDPARCYEIHLMKDFAGFERRLWLTGFTNYRFVIPELAGGEGRAIYNDTDQIYLQDPAILFDTPMGDHGVLSINDHDTSVMLMDCAKMVGLWNWQSAKSTRNRQLEQQMRDVPGLWGTADGAWNARDAEYVPGESAVVHYTTIHTQPWRPFPQDYVYQANPASDIWLDIERDADVSEFQLFSAEHPSPEFSSAVNAAPTRTENDCFLNDYRRLVTDAAAESLQYCGANPQTLNEAPWPERLSAEQITTAHFNELHAGQSADVVVCDGMEQLPDLDIAWLLDRLFACAERAVIIGIDLSSGTLRYCPADPLWWYAQVVAASERYPNPHWRLVVRERRFPMRYKLRRWSGGALLNTPPVTWTLLHYKTGHASQALGIADALGWPYVTRNVARTALRYFGAALASSLGAKVVKLPGQIESPWPELVIASGWLPSLVARWIARQNHGNTRLVLMGRRGGPVGESQNIALHCKHFGLPPHPQHIETLLPPAKVSGQRMHEAGKRWPNLYGEAEHPHVALLVGGDSAQAELTTVAACDLAKKVRKGVEAVYGRLAVLPSRRSSEEAVEALRSVLSDNSIFVPFARQAAEDNPYLGYLAAADILIVTGESESMLAEAVATGKPVYIFPLPASAPNLKQRLSDWVYKQARTDRFNARGSRRPQEGLQYLCARLVEYRVFLPRRDMQTLHNALIDQGLVRELTGSLKTWQPSAWREMDAVAARICGLLQPSEPTADSGPAEAENQARRAVNV